MRMKQQKALPFGLSGAETRRGKWAMVSAVIFCMAAHAFSYFNLSPIHDWLLEYGIQSYLHQVRLGRPLLAAYLLGKGRYALFFDLWRCTQKHNDHMTLYCLHTPDFQRQMHRIARTVQSTHIAQAIP